MKRALLVPLLWTVLALPAGLTVMRFLPPLVITQEDLAVVVEKVKMVLGG